VTHPRERQFSVPWAAASTLVFFVSELVLGGLVGRAVVTRYESLGLANVIQGVLNLIGYFVGGFFIGFVSPGIRVLEPAVGAFFSVALVLVVTLFTPYAFLNFSLTKLLVGGAIAFLLAYLGARLGERAAGNPVD
jgi:hypothetical protein